LKLNTTGVSVEARSGSEWDKSNTERWERGFAALSKFRAPEGHCCPWRHQFQVRPMGVRSTLSQTLSASRAQTTFEPNRICLGLARRSLGTKFCGAFKVRTTDGTLLRADLSQSR